ncbi:MAG TPA: ABC transporter permease [Cyclobacteriaceae bacterium]
MKIRATIVKEFLLLIRDPGGMALIFLMPLTLVIVMALIQDAPFRDYQEMKLDVIFVDNDSDSLGRKIEKAFTASGNVHLIAIKDTVEAKRQVLSGNYKAAIILPRGASESLRSKTGNVIQSIFINLGMAQADSTLIDKPSIDLQLLFDPAIKMNYKEALSNALEKVLANVQTEWMLDELQLQLSDGAPRKNTSKIDFAKLVSIKENYASKKKERMMLNSVQHNVPAWTMFAMFFILFPLAGNFIKEREEGSMLRLRLISGSQFPVIAGKFAFYFGVCLIQFVLMIAVGVYLMPVLGLQQLILGSNILGIAITACCVAMAATGYGLLIAVYFKTAQQALSFGSISVVILAALGGVWVPIYVMPETLQQISRCSPLNWGLESFTNLFLRGATTVAILPDLLKLVAFAIVTLAISVFIHKSRTIRN